MSFRRLPVLPTTFLGLGFVLLLVSLAYARHFHNAFHFDDSHTIVTNPYIRELRFVPRYFTDARTFSVLPRNRMYRPLVSASLAFDYWLGGGLNPVYFHASTFGWYLVQLVVLYFLARIIFERSQADPRNRIVALFATAWYGLHPAMAETVNYIIQRGDLYSTLGVGAGILIYAAAPGARKFGLYLLPVVAALFSKPPALVFPALLFFYIWLLEEDGQSTRLMRSLARAAPAILVTAAMGWLNWFMTPREFNPGVPSASAYRITQPLVALRYFRTFFLPGNLTADTDMAPVASVWRGGAWIGFLFVIAILALIWFCSRRRELRPIAFGLAWFLLALIPTSVFPLSEVENDHRMFFPFMGLVIGVSWALALAVYKLEPRRAIMTGLWVLAACELGVLTLGTMQRNLTWRTEESLWRDVTIKSPRNPRGLLNYAVSQLEKGDLDRARSYLEKARAQAPYYHLVEANLGVVNGRLKLDQEAERHFRRALQLLGDPADRTLFARWLEQHDRLPEALVQAGLALKANPDFLPAAYMLMGVDAKRRDWDQVRARANAVLTRFQNEPTTMAFLLMAAFETDDRAARVERTAENFVNLSVLYYQLAEFPQCILAAREALKLNPRSPEALTNLAAAHRELGEWDEAIAAAREALAIRPGFAGARANLVGAEAGKLRGGTSPPSSGRRAKVPLAVN